MIRSGMAALMGALVLFLVFFANVAVRGAKMEPLISDLAEMLTLFAAVILFVIGILAKEAAAERSDDD